MQREVVAAEGGQPPALGPLLRMIEQQARKTCDTDTGGCGWEGAQGVLVRWARHDVPSLGLGWALLHPSPQPRPSCCMAEARGTHSTCATRDINY